MLFHECKNCFVQHLWARGIVFDFLQARETCLVQKAQTASEALIATLSWAVKRPVCEVNTFLLPRLLKSGFIPLYTQKFDGLHKGQFHLYLSAFVGIFMSCHFVKLHMPIDNRSLIVYRKT